MAPRLGKVLCIVDGRPPPSASIMQAMANVLIRDLPDDVHSALRRRAEGRGQSLQQYLTTELTQLASRPSLEELFERIESESGGRVGLITAVDDLEAERSGQ